MKSKQLSIISRRPDLSGFKFFLDRQIDGSELYQVLVDSGMSIERHCDNFDPDIADDLWIRAVAEKSWIAITADKNIERDYLDVICETRAKMIMLTDNRSGYPQWAASIVASQNAFLRVLSTSMGPLIIRLSRQGTISLVRDMVEVENRRSRAQTMKIFREKKAVKT